MKQQFTRLQIILHLTLLSMIFPIAQAGDFTSEARATYNSIQAMVEPSSGLPNDKFSAALFDIMPQFAMVRPKPLIEPDQHENTESSLKYEYCTNTDCRYSGNYGLKLEYNVPSGTWASYSQDSLGSFDVSKAAYLELYIKGVQGGERFELVLWDNCEGGFPGRPESAVITATQNWAQQRIPLTDFKANVNLSSLCRLSVGFNDGMHTGGGTIYLDKIAFVDHAGKRIKLALDEETNVTNIGLYIVSVLGALELGWENYVDVVAKLSKTVTSIEAFQKWHGFPQTHNHVVSLKPSDGDTCISTVDLGNLAASLVLLRQRIPELSKRVTVLLDAMEWDWLYDKDVGLPYGCRYPDGSASTWHYDWLVADSRLAHFIGIGTEKMPVASWNKLNRTKKSSRCNGMNLKHFKPDWDGGGLFMAFLPAIFLDEANGELGASYRNFVQDQICYAKQIGAPAWGWSATAMPPHGADYCGYRCVRDDVLVPHASILAVDYVDSAELVNNLQALESLGARTAVTDGEQTFDFGFHASVDWQKNEVASVYLVLDQSMAFLSLVNHATKGRIRSLFCQDRITQSAISKIPDYKNSCIPPPNCQVYGVNDKGLNNSQFISINPKTLEIKALGEMHKGQDIEALDINNTGVLYAASGDDSDNPGNLYIVNTQIGTLTSLGYTGFDEIEGLSFKGDILWAWAKSDGLVSINLQNGATGTLVISSNIQIEDLTWNNDGTLLYGTQNNNLWVYDGNTVEKACYNFPREVEAIEMLPDGSLLLGIHGNNNILQFQALNLETCEIVFGADIPTDYDDIEGIAYSAKACANN